MTSLSMQLPASWRIVLAPELAKPYFGKLDAFLVAERAANMVFPPPGQVFRALELTPFEAVSAVMLGQDPYHDLSQAHGLAFSVRPGIRPPPSLGNIYKELETDIGLARPKTGCLEPWAKQGVLLLNTVLTVRAHEPGSHQKHGWETFTDAIIRAIAARAEPAIFVLWGAHAQKKVKLIETSGAKSNHVIIQSAHPSPLSARNGFFGSKPFSRINTALDDMGKRTIDWALD